MTLGVPDEGCETLSSYPLLALLGCPRSTWTLGDEVKRSWVFSQKFSRTEERRGKCGLRGHMGEACPIFLRWRKDLAKAGKPCVGSLGFLSHSHFDLLGNSLRPTRFFLYFSLGLSSVHSTISHDFPAPTPNAVISYPWRPCGSRFKVLWWSKFLTWSKDPHPVHSPVGSLPSSQPGLLQFLYRSVLCPQGPCSLPPYTITPSPRHPWLSLPSFQRSLPQPLVLHQTWLASPATPRHLEHHLSFPLGTWSPSVFSSRASSPRQPCPPLHHCIYSTWHSPCYKADAQPMFVEWTFSEKLLEGIPCSQPHVSLWDASLRVTSLLLRHPSSLHRGQAVVFLSGRRAHPAPLGPRLCFSFAGQLVLRTHRFLDSQGKAAEQVCVCPLSLWHKRQCVRQTSAATRVSHNPQFCFFLDYCWLPSSVSTTDFWAYSHRQ